MEFLKKRTPFYELLKELRNFKSRLLIEHEFVQQFKSKAHASYHCLRRRGFKDAGAFTLIATVPVSKDPQEFPPEIKKERPGLRTAFSTYLNLKLRELRSWAKAGRELRIDLEASRLAFAILKGWSKAESGNNIAGWRPKRGDGLVKLVAFLSSAGNENPGSGLEGFLKAHMAAMGARDFKSSKKP